MSKTAEMVGKLLRKAEATTSSAEAEALYAKAQALATTHAIDLAVARSRVAEKEEREQIEERTLKLTEPGMQSRPQFAGLYQQIAHANDVQMLISPDSTTVYPMGLPSDLDMVEQLYLAMVSHMVRGANDYLATGEHKLQGIHGKTARRNFYDGFSQRIGVRLRDARQGAVSRADEDRAQTSGSADGLGALSVTTLALRDKAEEVADFYEAKKIAYKVTRTWQGSRRQESLAFSVTAHRAGAAAGSAAPLTRRRSVGAG